MAVANCCDEKLAGAGRAERLPRRHRDARPDQGADDAGIDTFVVGIPGSEAYSEALDAFAKAGGRARAAKAPFYYQVSASGSADPA